MILKEKIIQSLQAASNRKAKDIARELGVTRKEVNGELYRHKGRLFRKDDGHRWGLADEEKATLLEKVSKAIGDAVPSIRAFMEAPGMSGRPAGMQERFTSVVEVAKVCDPTREIIIEGLEGIRLRLRLYIQSMSISDPYVAFESLGEDLYVVINDSHPLIEQVPGDSFPIYLKHCVCDALAEYQAKNMHSQVDTDAIRLLKDRLLRGAWDILSHEE